MMKFLAGRQQGFNKNKNTSGFTLIEILLVLFITVILAGIGFSFYFTEQRAVMVLRNAAREMVGYLYFAQNKAIIQEERADWGIHFNNPTTGAGFYTLYIGSGFSSAGARETRHLPSMIEYVTPARGVSIDVNFPRLTGRSLGNRQIVIRVINTGFTSTIDINTEGVISYIMN